MTKQEQIYGIAKYVCNACEFGIYKACSERQADVKSCSLALGTAKHIYNAGYRKVPDGAVVLTPEERDEEMKATNEILAERDDLKEKVESLKSEKEGWKMRYSDSGQKNKKLSVKNAQLKAENEQLKTECALLDDELRIARQDTIDVLNKLKEKIVERMGDREYMGVKYKQGVFSESEIDDMIAEVQNAEDKS